MSDAQLDQEVAVQVMGWELVGNERLLAFYINHYGSWVQSPLTWHPCTNPAQAVQVFEANVCNKGLGDISADMEDCRGAFLVNVGFPYGDLDGPYASCTDEFGPAICKAALLSMTEPPERQHGD
jgi:hypothetical protein